MLAYVERQGDQDLLQVVIFDTPTSTLASKPITVVTGMLGHPVWSPDGQQLGFVSFQGGRFVVQTIQITLAGQALSLGTPRTVAGTEGIDAASTFELGTLKGGAMGEHGDRPALPVLRWFAPWL